MNEFERHINQVRRNQIAIEDQAARDIANAYRRVLQGLRENLDGLTRQITSAQIAGEVRPSWLYQQGRYQLLLRDLEQHTADWAAHAARSITEGQANAARAAPADMLQLTAAALGEAPEAAKDAVLRQFARLPAAALDDLIGRSTQGHPLAWLLKDLPADARRRTADALASGLARGASVRVIAHDVHQEAGWTLNRALLTARTEIIGASRRASQRSMQHSGAGSVSHGGVVKSWIWHAAEDERTCPVCLTMHGTEHPISEVLASHPACRCTMVPKTRTWAELGFPDLEDAQPVIETGVELFNRMSREERLHVLGPKKLAAWERGEFTLPDLVAKTDHPVFGPGLRERALRGSQAASKALATCMKQRCKNSNVAVTRAMH